MPARPMPARRMPARRMPARQMPARRMPAAPVWARSSPWTNTPKPRAQAPRAGSDSMSVCAHCPPNRSTGGRWRSISIRHASQPTSPGQRDSAQGGAAEEYGLSAAWHRVRMIPVVGIPPAAPSSDADVRGPGHPGRLECRRSEQRRRDRRVADGASPRVVVEVDEPVRGRWPRAGQTRDPRSDGVLGVAWAWTSRSLVQPEVCSVRRPPLRRDGSAPVGQAERRRMAP